MGEERWPPEGLCIPSTAALVGCEMFAVFVQWGANMISVGQPKKAALQGLPVSPCMHVGVCVCVHDEMYNFGAAMQDYAIILIEAGQASTG